MDRRQKKTREAIFKAFSELLSKKEFSQITVAEIIELADVGRATFYAHFETKESLLEQLCHELFCHVFDSQLNCPSEHKHIFECDTTSSVFEHLYHHFSKNDNNILGLLASRNNDVFLRYFKENLKELVKSQLHLFKNDGEVELPLDFRINHICSTFVETLRWWVDGGMKESVRTITAYFFSVA